MHAPLLTAEVPGANPGAGTFQRSTSGIDEETDLKSAAPSEASRVQVSGAPPIHSNQRQPKVAASLSFPSVAQQQSTRLITGRPWSVTTLRDHFHFSRWIAQTDERRTEAPQRLARYQLQRPFSRGIDVTASMSVFHTERAGAAPACRTPFKRLRGRLRKAPALKQDHVGANPTGVPLFIPFVV